MRISIVLGLFIILVLAACGGENSDSEEAANEDTSEQIEQSSTNASSEDTGASADNAPVVQTEEEDVTPPIAEEVFTTPYLADYDEIVFSADQSRIALLNEQTNELQVMDAATGEVLTTLNPDPNWVNDGNNRGLALSNDGALVSVWYSGRGSNVDGIDSGAIYDVETGEIVQAFNYPYAVLHVVFNPTGERYAILSTIPSPIWKTALNSPENIRISVKSWLIRGHKVSNFR